MEPLPGFQSPSYQLSGLSGSDPAALKTHQSGEDRWSQIALSFPKPQTMNFQLKSSNFQRQIPFTLE